MTAFVGVVEVVLVGVGFAFEGDGVVGLHEAAKADEVEEPLDDVPEHEKHE